MSGATNKNETVTVSVRSLILTGMVLLALAVAYLLGNSGDGAPAQAAADQTVTQQGRRTLTMDGSGEATAVPDELSFALSVGVTRPALDTALDDANRTMERVLASLQEFGVKRGDVQTTGLSMNPVYDYPAYSPPILVGYHVSERAAVLVKELKQGGGAVSAAVAAGGNGVRVSDIKLQIADPDTALAKARKAAVERATAKAQEYAAATGQDLGDVITLREVSATPRSAITQSAVLSRRFAAADVGGLSPLPVRSGRQDLSVVVEVVWEFAEVQR